jgi:hypothetical protein
VAYIVAVFGVAEAFGFAHMTLTTFDLAATVPTKVQQFVTSHPGDYRILNPAFDGIFRLPVANSAIAVGARDISGYDPLVSRRYSELMSFSQGLNPDDADMVIPTIRASPLWRLLRLRYVFSGDQMQSAHYLQANSLFMSATTLVFPRELGPLPHVLLVDGWQRIERRKDIFAALTARSFDPGKTVILESDPDPAPVPSPVPPGTTQLLSTATDSLTIAADVTRPALLLITDSYSRFWRAVPLKGSSQTKYQVMPADYTIMAVPLRPGHHLFRLEYAPSGWLVGRWISLASVLLYISAIIWWRQELGSTSHLERGSLSASGSPSRSGRG